MLKNKRFFSLTMVLVLVMGVLTGCGSKDTPKADGDKDKVEISVWLTPQWKGVLDDSEEGADFDSFFKEAAKRFEEEYKEHDVKVNVEVIAGDQRDELLNVNLSGGTQPNVFFESVFAMGDYVHRGALVALDDIIDQDAKEDIAENFFENVTFGDSTYFYPFSNNPGTLVYNADMLKAAGLEEYIGGEDEIKTWTVEEFDELLAKLKENLPNTDYNSAYPLGLFALNNQGDTWNLGYLRMFGNKFFSEDGQIVLNDEKGEKAVEWLQNAYQNKLTNPGAESVSSNDVLGMFQNQQVAIGFTNSILYNNHMADMEAGTAPKFDARLANIPSVDGANTFTYVVGASVFENEDDLKVKVSKDFVKFFSSDKELVKASKNGVPVRTSVAEEFKDTNPFFKAYNENSKYLFNFTGNVPGYSELREVLYPELQAVYTGEKTPKEAVESYETLGNQVIEKAKESSVIYK